MEIWYVDIAEGIPEAIFQQWITMVTPEKKDRLQRYYHRRDAEMGLVGDIMARLMIQEKVGLSNNEIQFVQNQYGKPYLQKNCGYYFNVSHSGTYVVCAIDRTEIGIDIEIIKEKNLLIAKQFFSRP